MKSERKLTAVEFSVAVRTDADHPDHVDLHVHTSARSVIVALKRNEAARLGRMLVEAASDAVKAA